jgi:hypothetical protein
MREVGLANYLSARGHKMPYLRDLVLWYGKMFDEICFPDLRKYDSERWKEYNGE